MRGIWLPWRGVVFVCQLVVSCFCGFVPLGRLCYFVRLCALGAGGVACGEVCASPQRTSMVITFLRFHHAWGSRHIDRMSCIWFAWWSRLGLMANNLDPSYGREWLRIFGWIGHAMLVLMRKLEWCGRRVRMCTCGRNACGSCSKCGTFWRFYPKGDG